ncbi:MAG TPA: stage III sporulation protein AA [Firmicutes bacterium]|nr:stage III sporulation protein AA [Bacillota bacterium]
MVDLPWQDQIYPFLAGRIRSPLKRSVETLVGIPVREIRLRVGQRPQLVTASGEAWVELPDGNLTFCDIWETLQLISGMSVYAMEEQIKNGFITVRGGHRVGLGGTLIVEDGEVRGFKSITFLNIRLASQVLGAADAVLPRILTGDRKGVLSTLIVSPPGCGKTTMLRDLVRQCSTGRPDLGFAGLRVVVVDERSEIAACCEGVPQNDVGPRTDVLDACPKARGLIMAIRSMGPQLLATDEVGGQEDCIALREAALAGVSVAATAHASGMDDLMSRKTLGEIVREGLFARVVLLSSREGPGTIEKIVSCGGVESA